MTSAGITQGHGSKAAQCRVGLYALDVAGHGIQKMHGVTVLQKFTGICTRAAANVQHRGGRRGQNSSQDIQRAGKLDQAQVAGQTVVFTVTFLVRGDLVHTPPCRKGRAGAIRRMAHPLRFHLCIHF